MKPVRAVLICAVVLGGCGEELTVSQQIIAEIREMERQIEDGERLGFMSHVAGDFLGQGGSMTRDELQAYVVLQFNRFKQLEARLLPIEVAERGEDEATATFRALLTGGAGLVPESGQLYEIVSYWRLEDGEWLLAGANWKPLSFAEPFE